MSSVLPESVEDLAGRVGEQRHLVLFGLEDRAAEVSGLVNGVGVGEEQPVRGGVGGLEAGPAGLRFAVEGALGGAEVELGRGEDGDAFGVLRGDFLSDGAGAVGGGVIDDDELPLLAELEAGLGLRDQRGEAGREVGLLVARGDDDAEQEGPCERWMVGIFSTDSYYRKEELCVPMRMARISWCRRGGGAAAGRDATAVHTRGWWISRHRSSA